MMSITAFPPPLEARKPRLLFPYAHISRESFPSCPSHEERRREKRQKARSTTCGSCRLSGKPLGTRWGGNGWLAGRLAVWPPPALPPSLLGVVCVWGGGGEPHGPFTHRPNLLLPNPHHYQLPLLSGYLKVVAHLVCAPDITAQVASGGVDPVGWQRGEGRPTDLRDPLSLSPSLGPLGMQDTFLFILVPNFLNCLHCSVLGGGVEMLLPAGGGR